jgi:Tol biopolymer transport system component
VYPPVLFKRLTIINGGEMNKIIRLVLILLFVLFSGCENSANPSIPTKDIADYENHYKILFRRGNNFFTIHSDSTNEIQLTNTDAPKHEAIWSPDESTIAFVSEEDGTLQIYIMNSDGSNIRKLSQNPDWNLSPHFTADGQNIIYYHELALYIVGIDGNNHRELVSREKAVSSTFSTHPYYNMILYSSFVSDTAHIYEYSIDNSSNIKITANNEANFQPVYSFDGTKIAYRANIGGQGDILTSLRDGSNLIRLTSHSATESSPVWSPDNSNILFQSNRNNENAGLYQISADGTTQIKISNYGRFASWSPDMTRISYSVDTDDSQVVDTIFFYDVESGAVIKLVDGHTGSWSKIKI